MGRTPYSEEDLRRLGLEPDKDGTWRKGTKKVLTPVAKQIKVKTPKSSEATFWKGMSLVKAYEWATANGYIFIPGNVPSSKNSKQIFKTKSGAPFITSSEKCKEYVKATDHLYRMHSTTFRKMIEGKPFPINLEIFLIRDRDNDWDYVNISQISLDLIQDQYETKDRKKVLIEKRWLPNDSARFVKPVFSGYAIDKLMPGILFKIR